MDEMGRLHLALDRSSVSRKRPRPAVEFHPTDPLREVWPQSGVSFTPFGVGELDQNNLMTPPRQFLTLPPNPLGAAHVGKVESLNQEDSHAGKDKRLREDQASARRFPP
jgi:hypothetical protein